MRRPTIAPLLLAILVLVLPAVVRAGQVEKNRHAWDGSQATPVHLLPLKDEFDQPILPSESYSLPYSHRYTCAPCHDYGTIQQGLHFNADSTEPGGRAGEPWLWLDPKTGTVLPLSYRDWEGVWHPEDLGLSPWDFTLLFARHMTGGGRSEVLVEEFTPDSRWEVSGTLEINCMGCHNAGRIQNHSEWAKQVLRENFRWGATAASGLGEVSGMASRLPATWDIFDGPNPDDTEWAVVPNVSYRPEIFDSKHRVFFDIGDKVEDGRCLACHSVTPVGRNRYQVTQDVHAAAGIGCVDCHRHDLTHRMARGYAGEAEEYGHPEAAAFSCRGCHLGEDGSHGRVGTAGHLGAPRPRHAGFPAVHFERLACTVCHSGPVPDKEGTRVRTSRANRLGIYGIADWATDLPHIEEPVFVRDSLGRLVPNRLVWPSYWARLDGESTLPLRPAEVSDRGAGILDLEEDIAAILAVLSVNPAIGSYAALTVGERMFNPNLDGKLDVSALSEENNMEGRLWALRTEEGLVPLIPNFDPLAEEPDPDIEVRIQSVLESLAALERGPGQPAVIHGNARYRMVEGFLNMTEFAGTPGSFPGLFWEDGDSVEPLVSDFHLRTIQAVAGREETLTEEQVQRLLERLEAEGGEYAYVAGGRIFRLDGTGGLSSAGHAAAEPVAWPLAHPVRPAQQSLGLEKCTECHREGSPFFFRKVNATGPLVTQQREVRSASSFMGLDWPYQKLFGLSFRVRPLFKVVLAVAAVFLGMIVMIVLVTVLGRAVGLIEKRK
ncbi:MAG: hypothetical protein WBB73_14875 [Candidatus Aminicenantaceae bacterium]